MTSRLISTSPAIFYQWLAGRVFAIRSRMWTSWQSVWERRGGMGEIRTAIALVQRPSEVDSTGDEKGSS